MLPVKTTNPDQEGKGKDPELSTPNSRAWSVRAAEKGNPRLESTIKLNWDFVFYLRSLIPSLNRIAKTIFT